MALVLRAILVLIVALGKLEGRSWIPNRCGALRLRALDIREDRYSAVVRLFSGAFNEPRVDKRQAQAISGDPRGQSRCESSYLYAAARAAGLILRVVHRQRRTFSLDASGKGKTRATPTVRRKGGQEAPWEDHGPRRSRSLRAGPVLLPLIRWIRPRQGRRGIHSAACGYANDSR